MSKKTRKKSAKPKLSRAPAKKVSGKKSKPKSVAAKKVAKKSSKKVRKAKNAVVAPLRKIAFLAEGDTAPSFVLPRDGGQSVALADFAGRRLAIFFYPRADTPGCTREAMDFSRLSNAFAAGRTAVLGVSADPIRAQESFRDKHKLSVPLVSDETHTMLKAYGVWGEKSMYGTTFMGILRTTVLIDARGKIARIWRNVRVDGHADEVLAAARSL